jgi:hypothetical protein
MASTPDVTSKKLSSWDEYKDKQPDQALQSIYKHAEDSSAEVRIWYWKNIKKKKRWSLLGRKVAFGLLIFGTAFPIFAGLSNDTYQRLIFTQCAVAFLVVAALITLGDKVFGWSSGWMRYITTVTTMENLTRAFELEWIKYLVSKNAPLDSSDVKALFELAQGLEQELIKLQADETTKWVAEFNASLLLLESVIKTQREETDKKIEAIRTTLTTKEAAEKQEEKAKEAAAKEEEKAKRLGAVEATLVHKGEPKKVLISLDDEPPKEFLGNVWSKKNVRPGQHLVIIRTISDHPVSTEKIVEVLPAGRAEVKVEVG